MLLIRIEEAFPSVTLYVLLLFSVACTASRQTDDSPSVDETTKIAAARATATANSYCAAIQPFYWEIGSANDILGSGTTGDNSVTSATTLSIASASKFIFASYVLEKRNGSLSPADIKLLNFTSGYSTFSSCVGYFTVSGCYAGVTAYVAEG